MMPNFSIHRLSQADRDWVREKILASWEADVVVAHGKLFRPVDLAGFAAFVEGVPVGLATYHIHGRACEIVTLDSWCEGIGVGSALVEAVRQAADQAGCRRLFLVTTNNNLRALHFYQKRGFVIARVRVNAIAFSRKLKPEIPFKDEDGLPIRDEVELEMAVRRTDLLSGRRL